MKKIFIFVMALFFVNMAYADKESNIQAALKVVEWDYKGGDFKSLEKWVVYDLEEENTQLVNPSFPPIMIFLLNKTDVMAHYYVTYDSDLKTYGYSFCNCCHLEEEDGNLIAHCEEHCTKPPFTKRSELEPYKQLMGNKLNIR